MNEPSIYHVFINQDVANASSFTKTINCPFTPSKVKVNYIAYYNGATETGISFISSSNLIKNDEKSIIGAFSDNATPIVLGSEFSLGYPVRGSYIFQLLDISLALDTSRGGSICIDLEFVK